MQVSEKNEALIASPVGPFAQDIMFARVLARQKRGRWDDEEIRREFRIFYMLDGRKAHTEVSELLHIDKEKVRRALIRLMLDHLVLLRNEQGREITLNAQVLSNSFKEIKPNGMLFAEHFYAKLFARSAEAKHLFAQTNMKEQCAALLKALAFVVVGVMERKDITEDLAKLGAKHRGYGVKDEHYRLVGVCLLETLQEYFGREWTPELAATWADAYDVVSSIMLSAPQP